MSEVRISSCTEVRNCTILTFNLVINVINCYLKGNNIEVTKVFFLALYFLVLLGESLDFQHFWLRKQPQQVVMYVSQSVSQLTN